MPDKLRWGIISTARIGKNRVIPAIHDSANGEVVAVASRDLERAREFAEETDIPNAYGSYDDLLSDPDVDAVYNPLPNDGHAEWSIKALEAGKHVLCEKPLGANAAEARQMVDVANERKLLLAEAFMYRFHPQTLRVKQMVREGAVGKVNSMSSTFTFPISDENDIRLFGSLAGGAMMDVGCYCVGVMRFVLDEEPDDVSVYADVNAKGADERAVGILRFPSGVLGHFECGMRSQVVNNYEVLGSEGRILVETAFVPSKSNPTIIRYWRGDKYEDIEIPAASQYQLMVEDFADSILNKHTPRYPIEDSIRAMELLDRLRQSAGMSVG